MKYVLFSTFYLNIYLLLDSIIIIMTILSIKLYKEYKLYDYFIITINIFLEILFNIILFLIRNPFLLFSIKLIEFIFSIHLNEVVYSNKKSANLLVPYILWNFLLTLFTTIILFLNIRI